MSNIHGTIRVVSKRREAGAVMARPDEMIIDGDRSNPRLGNRHILSRHTDPVERAQVIESYRLDFVADIARNGPMSQAVDEIIAHMKAGRNVALRCWCAPRNCHLDLVAAEAARRLSCDAVSAQPELKDKYTDEEI